MCPDDHSRNAKFPTHVDDGTPFRGDNTSRNGDNAWGVENLLKSYPWEHQP
jgi:hypothetical protein